MPTEFVPDWKDTPLKKDKKFAALVRMRKEAADAIKAQEEVKKATSTEILTRMSEAGIDKVRFENTSISITTSTRQTFDQGKAKALLVEKYKLSLAQVNALWEACSVESSTSFISVRGE